MKLSKSQQAIVDRMKAEGLIIDVCLGMGISSKTRAVLTKNEQESGLPITYATVMSLKEKGAIYMYGGSYRGITHHFYKLKE